MSSIGLLLGLLVCAPSPGAAQGANGEAAEAKQEVEKPSQSIALAIAEVGVESERTKRLLAEISDALEPDEEVTLIGSAVPGLAQRVEQQLAQSESVRGSNPSKLDLEQLRGSWKEITNVLDRLQAKLRTRGAQVDAKLEVVRRRRAIWAATRATAVEQEVSAEVVKQIDDVEQAAALALEKATARQAAIIDLQSAVASQSETALGDLKRIDEIRNTLVGEVFTRDQPPIWSRDFLLFLDRESVQEDLFIHQKRERDSLRAFWARERTWVLTQLVAALSFALLMFLARNRIRAKVAQTVSLQSLSPIFDRPVALAFLISFFMALMSADPSQHSIRPLLGTAALVPTVLVLRKLLEPALYPMLNGIVAVFFLSQVREFIEPIPTVARLLFLLEMSIYFGLCSWWLRPSRLSSISPTMLNSRMMRVTGHGLRIVGIVSAAALVIDLAGYGALALLIGWTLIVSTYAAVILYGCVRAIEGLLALALAMRPLNLLGMVRRNTALVRQRVMFVVQLGAIYIWAESTLRNGELLDDFERMLIAILATALPLPEIEITVGDILASILTFYVATLLSRFVRFALAEDVFSRVNLRQGRPYAISALIHYTFLVVGFFLAVAVLGFDANRFTLLAGAFGVGIGFGLQNIVNNFTSGIILLTERPVEVGHTISLGETFGEVERIGIRSSTVRTWQGAEVIFPNADLISQQVTNWTLSDRRRRLEVPVGVAYGSDPNLVIETLMGAAKAEEQLLSNPEPYVLFLGFGDSSLDFELRAWTDEFDSFQRVRSNVCVAIEAALGKAGLTIPFPQRDLHIKGVVEHAGSEGADDRAPTVPRLAVERGDEST